MKIHEDYLLTLIGVGLSAAWVPQAEARTWTDASGGYTVEAEFVSIDGGLLSLETAAGRAITLPLAKLSVADRAFVTEMSAPATSVAPGVTTGEATPIPVVDAALASASGEMEITAKGKLAEWFSSRGGKETVSHRVQIEVDLIGGDAASVYSVGPVEVVPLDVGGKSVEMAEPIGMNGFKVVDRSKTGIFVEHPVNGIRAKIGYGEVPADTKTVGPVKGTVKVLTGGIDKEVLVSELLTRAQVPLKDAALTAAGINAKFTRQDAGDEIEVGIEMDGASAKAFIGVKLVGADGEAIEAASSSYTFGSTAGFSETASEAALDGASLKLIFREGGLEVELPFDVPEVEIEG
jgi:hypothetical protein